MNEKGMTLIEVLASIVILSIIVVSLLTFFVQSSRSSNISKNITDATYIAENEMEGIYGPIASSISLSTFATPSGYTEKSKTLVNGVPVKAVYEKDVPKHYISLELSSGEGDTLVKVIVRVYNNSTKAKQEAQMELLLPWKK
jgi:prepilin-type N-terminal cleavage/methylation domain-containing protein